MNKRVVYTRGGKVEFLIPASLEEIQRLVSAGVLPPPDGQQPEDQITEDQAMQLIADKDVPPSASNVVIVDMTDLPSKADGFFDAWERDLTPGPNVISVNMPKARAIHAGRLGEAQGVEIARLKVEERRERLKGNTAQANAHAAIATALEALDLNQLATRIATAPNSVALSAVWPAQLPR